MTNEIQIDVVPNTNFQYTMYRQHEGRLQQTATTHGCRNRFEVNVDWGKELDEIDKQNLHACLDEWIKDRELEMAK